MFCSCRFITGVPDEFEESVTVDAQPGKQKCQYYYGLAGVAALY